MCQKKTKIDEINASGGVVGVRTFKWCALMYACVYMRVLVSPEGETFFVRLVLVFVQKQRRKGGMKFLIGDIVYCADAIVCERKDCICWVLSPLLDDDEEEPRLARQKNLASSTTCWRPCVVSFSKENISKSSR